MRFSPKAREITHFLRHTVNPGLSKELALLHVMNLLKSRI
jgi:hypothetical protein